MNRFETWFGDNGLVQGRQDLGQRLRPYGARYRFMDRTWGIVVWAYSWDEANWYARSHGMKIDGLITDVL